MTDTLWVSHLAEQLVCEVAGQMGNIRLFCDAAPSVAEPSGGMDTVYARTGGDHSISVWLRADRVLFVRFARNMLGREPDEDEVRAYAREFFNVICGRFISELILRADVGIRLMPARYDAFDGREPVSGDAGPVKKLNFVSDEKERAVFSWTSLPIEEILRRNTP